jgi:hypothetical protein
MKTPQKPPVLRADATGTKHQQAQHAKRQAAFQRWWAKNHSNKKAHTWLAHYVRTQVFAYLMAPEVHAQATFLTKRFFSSEHKKLSGKHAYQLWRIAHPTKTGRHQQLTLTAERLAKQKRSEQIQKQAKYVQVTVKKQRQVVL